MKKTLKRIGISLLIIFIVAICLSFIGVVYLFLWPGSELFGIVYMSDKMSKVYTLNYTESELINLKEIEIKTIGYDIKVVADDSVDNITAYVKNNVSGFALKKNSVNRLNYNLNDNNVLALNMDESTGWVSAKGSYVNIHVPKNIMENNIKLKISTGKKSDINIDGGEYTKLSDLDLNLNRGKLFYNGLEAENVYIKANKAEIAAGAKVTGVTNYMSLDIGNSHVNLLNAGDGAKYLLSDEIPEVDKINYRVNNLVIKSATKNGRIRLFDCGYLYTADNYIAKNGKIEIYYVEKAKVIAKDTKVWIYNLTNTDESKFTFSGKGSLDISYNSSNLSATTNSGEVLVGRSDNVMSLETNNGKISIFNAKKPLSLIVNKGEAFIEFDEQNLSEPNSVQPEIISLRTHSGKIKIENVNKINAIVDEGGKPNIEIHYNKLSGVNVIDAKEAEDANIVVVVPKNEGVELDVKSYDSILNINVGATKHEGYYNGTYNVTVYEESTENILQIDFKGKASLYSDDVYELKK